MNNLDNITKRIDDLINIINKAIYEYYSLDNPTLTDQEYDDYYSELLRLENEYPELKRFHNQGYPIWYDEGIRLGQPLVHGVLLARLCALHLPHRRGEGARNIRRAR